MSFKFLDRAQMSVSGTPGTGNITLNAAVSGFQTFAQAGAVNGDTFSYVATDGTNFEYGVATYNTTGPAISRAVTNTSAQNTSPISLTSGALILACLRAEDMKTPMNAPSIVQTASAAAYQGTATATLGSTPTVGNTLFFIIGGRSSPYTLPSGITVHDDYGYNCIAGPMGNNSESHERILVASRVVQSGDGTSWAAGNTTDTISITVYEIANAGYMDIKGRLYYSLTNATDTSLAPSCCPLFGTALCIAAFEDDQDAYTGGGSIGSGWTLDYNAVPSGHGHCVVTQHTTSTPGNPVTASVTWHNGSTGQSNVQVSVTINPLK